MDWSLVLASQEISAVIVHSGDKHWGLVVDAHDYDRALAAIQQYRLENRKWLWHQPTPWSEAAFHAGALGWCLLLALVHWFTWNYYPGLREAAEFRTTLVTQGEWWRGFTAMLLHADLRHLLANLSTGLVLFGLVMARFGAGMGLLSAYLAGALGNLAGLLLYPAPYVGLGASGMVMGALGLIAIPPRSQWRAGPQAIKRLTQAICASVFLFILLGVNPASDVIAHTGGFVAGGLLGFALSFVPEQAFRNKWISAASWMLFLSLLILTAALAVQHVGGPIPPVTSEAR